MACSCCADITKDFDKSEHGCRMICVFLPLSLVWGSRTVMFQLYGFYCEFGDLYHTEFREISLIVLGARRWQCSDR